MSNIGKYNVHLTSVDARFQMLVLFVGLNPTMRERSIISRTEIPKIKGVSCFVDHTI